MSLKTKGPFVQEGYQRVPILTVVVGKPEGRLHIQKCKGVRRNIWLDRPNTGNENNSYCRTGVRSAHTTFVVTQLLDYRNV